MEFKNELRRFNFVHHIGLGTSQILEIRNDGVSVCNPINRSNAYFEANENIHRIEPIPLTEEIWAKTYFRKGHGTYYVEIGLQSMVYEVDKKEIFLMGRDADEAGQCFRFPIEYLHELQNAFKMLTRNELKLKTDQSC